MKDVLIPSNMQPWVCVINDKKYTYPAGTVCSVPDEVASLIEASNMYGETKPAPVLPPFDVSGGGSGDMTKEVYDADNSVADAGGIASYVDEHGGGSGLPDPEVADIGKVLGIVEDGASAKYALVADGGLPDPSALTDGTYVLTCTITDGEAVYSWETNE